MVYSQDKTETEKGQLMEIITLHDLIFYYQNFWHRRSVNWDSRIYSYLPFTWSGIPSSLDLDNVEATVILPNIPEISNHVRNYDGLRNATVAMYNYYPDSAATAVTALLQVRRTKFVFNHEGGDTRVEMLLSLPFTAVGEQFPNAQYLSLENTPTPDIIMNCPELPLTGLRVQLS